MLRLAHKLWPILQGDVGTIIEEGNLHFTCQKPGVILIIQPTTETFMLKRSAIDIKLNVGECIYAIHIADKEDKMIRYVSDRSRDHMVSRVSKYLQTFHKTWRITRVDRVSGMRSLNSN
jgi:hypothetical protein